MMQENNNFDTIINTWRRMSGEQAESVTVSMSGDSPDYQLSKKKNEESTLLVSERMRSPIATTAGVGVAAAVTEIPADLDLTESEEKLLKNDKEQDSKEAAGDAFSKDSNDYLENNDLVNKFPERHLEKSGNKQEKSSDKVDSVVLSPSSMIKPPPTQSSMSNPDEDDCIVKCLYYSLQCSDCVIM